MRQPMVFDRKDKKKIDKRAKRCRRISLPLTALLVVLLLAPWAVRPLFSAQDSVVRLGTNEIPVGFDPAQVWESSGIIFIHNIFECLVMLDPRTNSIVPCLALSWETSDQGKRWIFKLRKNVLFHDGTPFNADAVVFSFQRQLDPESKYRYYEFPLFPEIFGNLEKVEKLDEHTVAFHLNKPFYPFLAALTSTCAAVVSPSAVKKHGKEFSWNPVGSGPYRLTRYEKGRRVIMDKYPGYWRGAASIDRFISIIDNSRRGLQTQFMEHKIDIQMTISISRTVGLKRLSWVGIYRVPLLSLDYIAFNLTRPLLKDRNLRRALLLLWDPRIIRYVYQEYAEPAHSLLPPGLPLRPPATAHRFSLEEAQKILAQRKDKKPLKLTLILTENPGSVTTQIVSLYARNLKKAGIEVKIDPIPNDVFLRRVAAGEYDLASTAWVADYPDPHTFLYPLFSKDLMATGMPTFYSPTPHPVQRDIAEAAAESSSRKREELYKSIVATIRDEAICIPIYHDMTTLLYNKKRIKTLSVDAVGIMSFYNMTLVGANEKK